MDKFGRKFYMQDLKHWLNNTLNQILAIMQKNGSNVSHRASLKTMAKNNSVNNASKSININKVKNTKNDTDWKYYSIKKRTKNP